MANPLIPPPNSSATATGASISVTPPPATLPPASSVAKPTSSTPTPTKTLAAPASPETKPGWKATAWGLATWSASGLWGLTKTAAPILAKGAIDVVTTVAGGAKEIASGAAETTLSWALIEKFLVPAMAEYPSSEKIVSQLERKELLDNILKQLVPDIAAFLAKKNPGLNALYKGAKPAMLQGVYVVLFNAVAKLIEATPTEKSKPKTLFDVIGHLVGLLEKQHDALKDQLTKAGDDKKARNKILRELMQPILNIAFPKGADSLGFAPNALFSDSVYQKFIGDVSIKDEAWNAMQEHLPELVVDILNTIDQRFQAQSEAMTKLPDGAMRMIGIKAIAPWIASMAGKNEATANAFLSRCPQTLIKAIEFAIVTAALTADKGTRKDRPSVTDTLSHLASMAQSLYSANQPDIVEGELLIKEGDAKSRIERDRHIRALFEPVVKLADPTTGDVPLTEQTPAEIMILQHLIKKIWTELSPQLPAVGIKIYDMLMDSQAGVEHRESSLQTSEEGTALLSIANLTAQVVTSKLKTNPKVPQKAAELALSRLPDRTKEMAAGKWESEKKAFGAFLTGMVKDLLGAKSRALAPLMPLFQRRFYEITSKVFHHMLNRDHDLCTKGIRHIAGVPISADSKEHADSKVHMEQWNDPISVIMTQFRHLFSEFYQKQSLNLCHFYKVNASLPADDSKRKQWTKEVFGPLAESLLLVTGLDKEPLFGLQDTIKENLPGWLFDLYGMLIEKEPHLLLWVNPQAALDKKREKVATLPLGGVWIQVAERSTRGLLAQMPERLNTSLAHDIAQASVSKFCGDINQHNVSLLVDDTLQKLQALDSKWFDSITPEVVTLLRTSLTDDILHWLATRSHHTDHPIAAIFSDATKKQLAHILDDRNNVKAFDAWLNPKLESAVAAYLTPTAGWPKTIKDWLIDSLKSIAKHSATTLAKEAIHEMQAKEPFREWIMSLPESTLLQVESVITQNIKKWLAQKTAEPINTLIQKTFGEIIHVSPTFAKTQPSNPSDWSWPWLQERVQNLALQHAHVEPMWDFIDAHLQAVLLNSFARPDIGNVIAQCATKARDFIQAHGDKIKPEYTEIAKWNAKIVELDAQLIRLAAALPSEDVEKDRREVNAQRKRILAQRETHIVALVPTFQALAVDFLKLFGIDKENKLKVFKADALIAEKSAYAICQAFVEMMLPSEGYEVTFDRLCNLFFDQKVFQHKLQAQGIKQELVLLMSDPSKMSLDKRAELWKISEAAVMAKQVENVIRGFVAPYIRATVQDVAKKYDMQAWLRESYNIVINTREAELMRLELRKFVDNKAIGDYLEQLINYTLPQAFVNTVESIERLQGESEISLPGTTPQHHLYSAPYAFVRRMLLIRDKHLTARADREQLEHRIEDAEKESDPTVRREKLRSIFLPLAKEVLALVGNTLNDPKHPAYHWPLPMGLKTLFWNTTFPNIIADMMINGNKSIHWDTRQLKVQQEELYGSKHPIIVAEVAGRFTQAYMPHMLSTQAPQRSHELGNNVEALAKNASTGPVKDFHDYWLAQQPVIEQMLASNSERIGENREDAFKNFWDWMKDKAESFVMTTIGGLSNNLAKIEKHQPNFTMHMFARTMEIIDAHASRVNEITRRHGKSHPFQVDPEVMRKEFGVQLHEALKIPDGLTKAEAEKVLAERKMELFIKPITEQLLRLAGVTPKMMPKSMFKLLKDKLAPVMFSIVYEAMWSRQSGKNIQISLVTKWRENIRAALQQQAAGTTPAPKARKVSDKDLETFKGVSEPLLKELVDWLPGTLVNIVINNLDGVHKLTSEMLTNIAVDQAQVWTPIEMMRKMHTIAASSMQPANWNKRQPNAPDELDPKDIFVPSAPISFPRTTAEKEKELRDRIDRLSVSESEASSISVQLGMEGLNATIRTTARNKIWIPVTSGIDWISGKLFRSYGESVAAAVKTTLEYIGKLLSYLLYPLYIMFVYPIEWIHISIQERNLDRSASLPIHETLLMSLFTFWINESVAILEKIEREPLQAALKNDFNSVLEQLSREKHELRVVDSPLKKSVKPVAEAVAPMPSAVARVSSLLRFSPQRHRDADVKPTITRTIPAASAARFATTALLLGSATANPLHRTQSLPVGHT